ncbi:MAG: tRNA (adenosine(37)-N6)-threonylcarbamoyltransferase complex ATPase subunit type 1 TsaE [Candidatus Marinimicrobia bacterium]|nr:tRNA (adenosine(37)-N6)-threonylcarbamoyltransferase complex ATPase subunit type 1 TsaE [Candidatus Neomarinimicrobiota bacterium]
MIDLTSSSAAETERLGEIIASQLNRGDVLAFVGDLAAGKTTMIRGICRGLNIQQQIESPTYTLVNEYVGKIPVYHMDCYRENRLEEWLELGINDYFFGEGITLVEWADTIAELIPDTAIRIWLNHNLSTENTRQIRIEALETIEKRTIDLFKIQ